MKKTRKAQIRTLKAKREKDIDYSDIPALDARFLRQVELFQPTSRERISLRLDHEVIEWFKKQGSGYQAHINAVLKAFVHLHA